ncbi:uncharacterized protein J3D65DRAFT_620309 [Phyllosticta citribraziliensis]|uniref:Uncharacterized protein n=1 Tax=Phyllosticta citribraziliensis TaxID=989973 RepID=A0ABR1LXM1_9PEZI
MTSSRIFQTGRRFLSAHIGAVIGVSSLLGVEVGIGIGLRLNPGVEDFTFARMHLKNTAIFHEIEIMEKLRGTKPELSKSLQTARAKAYVKGYCIRHEGLTSWMAADMINLDIGLWENKEELVEGKKKRQLELFSHAIACLGVSEMLIAGLDNDETKCYELDKEKTQQIINCLDGIRLNLSFGLKPSSAQASSNNGLQMAGRLEDLAMEVEADGKLPMQWINSRRQPFCGMSSGRKLSDEELQDFSRLAQESQATHVSKLFSEYGL